MKVPQILGLHAEPAAALRWFLAFVPFLIAILVYAGASQVRLERNPQDKLLPSATKMTAAMKHLAVDEDPRSGNRLFWRDTASSLRRLVLGVGLAALVGLIVGLNIGLFPGLAALFQPALTFVAIIPPLAVLPVLFIVVGVDELAKVTLIFLGTVFVISRDTVLAVRAVPNEQITKALTLGASQLEVVYQVVLPQVLPRLVEAVRLSLGGAWLFLIAAEALASTDGLGYRIFLVRRLLSMDVILPYVLWITLLGFLMDLGLRRLLSWRFSWYEASHG